ncbi:Uncharacterised protein [Cedecea davisae]|nr:Uncharacterised protein [Cedecea davisae]
MAITLHSYNFKCMMIAFLKDNKAEYQQMINILIKCYYK